MLTDGCNSVGAKAPTSFIGGVMGALKKTVVTVGALATVTAGALLVRNLVSTSIISIHAPCTQSVYPPNTPAAYTGDFALIGFERGIIVKNPVTNAAPQFINGVWYACTGCCNSGLSDLQWTIGDCFQSVVTLTASNGTAKWVVAPGAPQCGNATHPLPKGMNGLMVWGWNGSTLIVKGLISSGPGVAVEILSTAILDHDTAWVKLTQNKGWVPCDLNAMTCAWGSPQPNPPAGEGRQSGVRGVTYNIGIDYAHPPENGGPTWFWMLPSDQPTPTRPPAPTATLTPTGVTRTPGARTNTPTYNPCPPFCDNTPTPGGSTRTRTPIPTITASPTPSAGQRWSVSVAWSKPTGESGFGSEFCVVSSPGSFSEEFWFFSPGNAEVSLKLLDGCSSNGNYWFFAAGLTNVEVSILIKDNITGRTITYHNNQGVAFPPIQDTKMEPCQ